MKKLLVSCLATAILTACGGGGSSSPSAVTPAPTPSPTCTSPQVLTNGVCTTPPAPTPTCTALQTLVNGVCTDPVPVPTCTSPQVLTNGVCTTPPAPVPTCTAPQTLVNGVCTSPAPVIPAPTVSITISQPKVTVGSSVTVTWSSTDSTSCVGGDGLAGVKPVSGSTTVTPTVGGQFKYTISCDGPSGSALKSVGLVVPIPVQKTSYLNFKNNGQGQTALPTYTHAMAYGDFFQDGTISLMMSWVTASEKIPSDITKTGLIYFYKKINGNWVDRTSEILKNATGCVWPRKAVSVDFNGDGKPDIFLACHGLDVAPWAGEKQILLLSQPDGTYKRSVLDVTCYCHGATAADFKGDGFADVIITDTSGQFKQPMYLRNNKDGTFTPSKTELSSEVGMFSFTNQTIQYAKPIYTLELVDVNGDGLPDLYVAGNEALPSGETEATRPDVWTTRFYLNSNNTFTGTPILMPIDLTLFVNLDVYVEGDVVWMLKTDYVAPQFKLVKYNIKTKTLLDPVYVPNDGIFWLIKDPVKGITTAG